MSDLFRSLLNYEQFDNMFDAGGAFQSFSLPGEKNLIINIEWKTAKCTNLARQAGGWCAILWKPVDADGDAIGKWRRKEFIGSSLFDMWWSSAKGEEDPLWETCEDCDSVKIIDAPCGMCEEYAAEADYQKSCHNNIFAYLEMEQLCEQMATSYKYAGGGKKS
jgi:hypothetical protein